MTQITTQSDATIHPIIHLKSTISEVSITLSALSRIVRTKPKKDFFALLQVSISSILLWIQVIIVILTPKDIWRKGGIRVDNGKTNGNSRSDLK